MNKYMVKTVEMLGFAAGILFNLLVVFLCVYSVYYFTVRAYSTGEEFIASSSVEKPFAEVTLTFKEATPVGEAAKLLEENGLIGNAYMYQFENYLKGSRDPYAPGDYVLNTQMDSSDINRTLRSVITQTTEVRITIPEGRQVKDIARYLNDEGLVTESDFFEACDTGDFRYDFISDIPSRTNRFEGYLFPDTYFVSEKPAATEVIDKMLYRFTQMYDWEARARADALGLTMDEVIIIASIIEKEIVRPEERALASAVIHNRLAQGMRLEMCSTIIYALGKNKDRLLDEDLQIESPYNTYINHGLPIGPIGNPGKACIDAALHPADVDYLFFVVMNEDTGEHFFTANYDDFLNAKIRYNQRF